jgi:hypothetical protein
MQEGRSMNRVRVGASLLIVIAAPMLWSFVSAQQAAPAPQNTQQEKPKEEYHPGDIFLKASRVYTLVGKTGLGHEHGVVGLLKSGTLHLGAEKEAGQMVFDMTSFQADTAAARKYVGLEGTSSESTQEQVTANMVGEQVLNVAKYPTATFVIHSALQYEKPSKRGLPQYILKGEFTLHETTRPLEFLVEVEMSKGWQHVRGGFRILQSEYGITPFTKAFGAVGVADQLTIWGDAWVAPAAGSAP